MVCSRCIMAVTAILNDHQLKALCVNLGEVILNDRFISKKKLILLSEDLLKIGFEIIDDKKSKIIERIKNLIVEIVHHQEVNIKNNLSVLLAEKLGYEYTYLSNLFSEVESTTIERYFIAQKIERVKELLVYDELSLSEIAYKLDYSSVAYLSSQFKKVTGLTPTFYKSLKENKRKNLEEL